MKSNTKVMMVLMKLDSLPLPPKKTKKKRIRRNNIDRELENESKDAVNEIGHTPTKREREINDWMISIVSMGKHYFSFKQMCSMIFYHSYFLKGASGFHVTIYEHIAAVFPSGSKKRKSNNDDNHGYGLEKRRPSTLC